MELAGQSTQRFVGVHAARQHDAASPGSGGASPYHRAAAPMTSPLMELAGQSTQRLMDGLLAINPFA
jgi:hypothetical protein